MSRRWAAGLRSTTTARSRIRRRFCSNIREERWRRSTNTTPTAMSRLRGSRSSCAGPRGRYWSRGRGFEIIPDRINPHGRHARTPLDRKTERAQRAETRELIEPMKVEGSRRDGVPRAKFSGLRQEPAALQRGYRDRAPLDFRAVDRQHRLAHRQAPDLGPRDGAVYERLGGERVAALRVSEAVGAARDLAGPLRGRRGGLGDYAISSITLP